MKHNVAQDEIWPWDQTLIIGALHSAGVFLGKHVAQVHRHPWTNLLSTINFYWLVCIL